MKNDTSFNSETAAKAGRMSKRKAFDKKLQEQLEAYVDAHADGDKLNRRDMMLQCAYDEFQKGNHHVMAYLMNRAFGSPTQRSEIDANVNTDITLAIDKDEEDV